MQKHVAYLLQQLESALTVPFCSPIQQHVSEHPCHGAQGDIVARCLGRCVHPLICVGDPRKGGSVWAISYVVDLTSALHVDGAVDRKSGSRWSARSAARTNDLEADEDAPHTGSARSEGKRCCGSSHVMPPRVLGAEGSKRGVPAPSLIWVHGRRSGDMMMDGVPGVRAGDGCGRSFFSGRPPRQRVAAGGL